MPEVTVNEGISLHYDSFGEGDPVMWIAGTGNSGPDRKDRRSRADSAESSAKRRLTR